jgi:hypothetical protein
MAYFKMIWTLIWNIFANNSHVPSARGTVFETIYVPVLKAHKIFKVYKLNII